MSFKEAITKCTLQVREECQFFGALMLFAEVKVTKKYSTAATDGKFIFMNESFFLGLSSKQQNALLLHEVLHMALLHVTRRGTRDVTFWNIAADIVVNNLILENTKYKLPEGAIVESYDTEEEVLLAWTRFIGELDPDFITGYNIFGFDFAFMWDRAEELGIVVEVNNLKIKGTY